jgi:hypothetical protein
MMFNRGEENRVIPMTPGWRGVLGMTPHDPPIETS